MGLSEVVYFSRVGSERTYDRSTKKRWRKSSSGTCLPVNSVDSTVLSSSAAYRAPSFVRVFRTAEWKKDGNVLYGSTGLQYLHPGKNAM